MLRITRLAINEPRVYQPGRSRGGLRTAVGPARSSFSEHDRIEEPLGSPRRPPGDSQIPAADRPPGRFPSWLLPATDHLWPALFLPDGGALLSFKTIRWLLRVNGTPRTHNPAVSREPPLILDVVDDPGAGINATAAPKEPVATVLPGARCSLKLAERAQWRP